MRFLRRWFGKQEPESFEEQYLRRVAGYRQELAAQGLSSPADLDRLLKPFIREAGVLKLQPAADEADDPLHSRFGGRPYFEAGEEWPRVGERPLTFVCQIFDPQEEFLPHGIRLLQFFYDFGELAFESGDPGWLVKTYVQPAAALAASVTPSTAVWEPTPCRILVETQPSLPAWDDISNFDERVSKLCAVLNPDAAWESYAAAERRLGGGSTYHTQLGGYPRWIQGDETPLAPSGEPMELLLQIDSEKMANLMWGDVGLVYLFFAAQHSEQFGFVLQSH